MSPGLTIPAERKLLRDKNAEGLARVLLKKAQNVLISASDVLAKCRTPSSLFEKTAQKEYSLLGRKIDRDLTFRDNRRKIDTRLI
ncbi:hypothetical protein LQW54_009616 [Pestalotiopsis sp. IQ-011]